MRRVYTGPLTPTAYTTADDLFECLADGDVPVEVMGWHLFNTTDLGDAEEETIIMEWREGVGATSGSGGTAAEFRRDINDAAAVCVIESGNTTPAAAGGGSLTTTMELGWNARIQWDFWFPEDARPRIDPGEFHVLAIVSAPADSITIGGTIWVMEI